MRKRTRSLPANAHALALTDRVGRAHAAFALTQGPKEHRIYTWVRIVGAVAAIGYGVTGVYLGIAQQTIGLPPEQVDCKYRVQLLRDRVVALTERSTAEAANDPQDNVVSTLIRESLAACAERDPQSSKELERIAAILRDHLEHTAREADARRELLAL